MQKKGYLAAIVLLSAAVILAWGCVSFSMVGALPKASQEEQAKEPEKTAEPAAEPTTGVTGEGLIGTWINNAYDNEGRSGMVVYAEKSDGTIAYTAYDKSNGTGDSYEGTVSIESTSTDAQGRTLIRSNVTLAGGMSWDTLARISADGSTLEVQSGVEKIDPKGPRYSIYYRK
ncbi:MAG: hypothetical protein JXQ30_05600 [Spirochaetes bacterium]|nr:hypothetical protein [Spirochaetota bacterium]